MKRLRLLLAVLIIALPLSSCNYKDLDKVLFVTAIIVDKGEQEGTVSLYFEAFRPSSSSKEEQTGGERIVYSVKNKELIDATYDITKMANLQLSFAQTKVLLFTRAAAEKGIDDQLNIIAHAEEFTIRTLIGIWDADPEEFGKIELKGEHFLGIYLRTHIQNTEKRTAHVRIVSLLELMNAAQVRGKVIGLPIIKPVMKGEEQLINIDEVALLRDYKMVGVLSSEESGSVNYMAGKVRSTFFEANNPDVEGAKVIIVAQDCDAKTKITPMGNRMTIEKKLKFRTLMRGSQFRFTPDKETFDKITLEVAEKIKKDIQDLYKKYANMEIDIFNLGEAIYRRYPWFDQEQLFDKIDLKVDVTVELHGTNEKWGFNTLPKSNEHTE